MPIYASAGIPEAWLLDVSAERLEVHRHPTPDGYQDMRCLPAGGEVTCGGHTAHADNTFALLILQRESSWCFLYAIKSNLPNHPVTGVSLYEAMAYGAWLQQQLAIHGRSFAVDAGLLDTLLASGNWQVRLPTEAEWEKAAGWDPGTRHKRLYAWGDVWDETKANVVNQVGRPSAVGVFPVGASAYDVLDMTGNV